MHELRHYDIISEPCYITYSSFQSICQIGEFLPSRGFAPQCLFKDAYINQMCNSVVSHLGMPAFCGNFGVLVQLVSSAKLESVMYHIRKLKKILNI